MSADLASISFVVGVVLFGMALTFHWMLCVADLLWMSAIRARLVGVSTLVSALVVSLVLDGLIRRQGLQATRLILLLAGTPIVTVPLCNAIARWRAGVVIDRKDLWARGFIFKRVRQKQQDEYVASLAPPTAAPDVGG